MNNQPTERMRIGVCTTISNNFLLPVFPSTCTSSPLSTRMMALITCVMMILLLRFRFVSLISLHDLGSCRSWWKVQGPGPMRLEAVSESSASVERGSTRVKRGEFRSASGESDSRGRSGSAPLPSPLTLSNVYREIGSVRAMRHIWV